jgi:hypothetical protein
MLKRNGQCKSEGDEAEIDNDKVKGCKAADDFDQTKLLQLSQTGPKFSHSTKHRLLAFFSVPVVVLAFLLPPLLIHPLFLL